MLKIIILILAFLALNPVNARAESAPSNGAGKRVGGVALAGFGGLVFVFGSAYSKSTSEKFFNYGFGGAMMVFGFMMVRAGNEENRNYLEWKNRNYSQHNIGIQLSTTSPLLAYQYEF